MEAKHSQITTKTTKKNSPDYKNFKWDCILSAIPIIPNSEWLSGRENNALTRSLLLNIVKPFENYFAHN